MLPPNSTSALPKRQSSKSYVLSACRAMLRPVVRMLIKSGIVHRDLLNLTREIYVEVARREFGLRGRPTSISRTALLTGLARKEVRRIMNILDANEGIEYGPSSQDRITRVLSGWFQDRDYLTAAGKPMAIPVDGPAPSFSDLKHRYGGDVPASAMLRELLNAGTAKKTASGLVEPVTRYFMPNPADPEHLIRAGSVVEDIGSTVIHNLYRDDNGVNWFERRATNTSVPEQKLQQFHEMVATEGQKFLEQIDAWMIANEDKSGADSKVRIGVGMYLINSNKPEE